MKYSHFLVLFIGLYWPSIVNAQQVPTFAPTPVEGKTRVQSTFTRGEPITASAIVNPKKIEPNPWDVRVRNHGISHGNNLPKSALDSIKWAKTEEKKRQAAPQNTRTDDHGGSSLTPVVQLDFQGNNFNGLVPPDNTIAVSDGGDVVSVTNSRLLFYDQNGTQLSDQTLANFFSPLNLTGTFFDPKVLYDPVEDKFILVVLSGTTPANSRIAIAFSTTSDPMNSWWLYNFNGNILNNNTWFDFPSIAVSGTELYVSGNLFNANNTFNQVLIYQIEKSNGFTGGTINWVYWNDVRDASNFVDFNVVPMGSGFDGSIGPGIYMVSTNSNGGSDAMLYYTTNVGSQSPQLVVNSVNIASYSAPGNGLMLGTTETINTNDCRTLSGFVGQDVVHFVLNTDRNNGFTGLYYGRIDISNINSLSATTTNFGLNNFEYAFPAVAPFTDNIQDKSVVMGFLRTGSTIYPEFRVVTCDDAMNWSNSVLVRDGDDFVNQDGTNSNRWGDYSGISRRHLSSGIEVWIAGCYGDNFNGGSSDILGTWIGKISGSTAQQQPVANFTASATNIPENSSVTFTDQSTNSPTGWTWNFGDGSPNSSAQNPTHTYTTAGTYTVSLTASNSAGNDTETKTNFITVTQVVQAPQANFTASATNIPENSSVTFTDQSTNSPTGWTWNFGDGSPNSSAQNPTHTYTTAGTYTVSLTASNSAGNDTETKTNYITVTQVVQAPQANFIASATNIPENSSVTFTDQSTNSPTGWTWNFGDGSPNSSAQNPTHTYTTAGTYTVSLTASNSAGNDTETKTNYITVTQVVQAPQADFIANPTTLTAGNSVTFTDQSTNSPTSWNWDFGDGSTNSSLQNPTHTYTTDGTYTVSLTASNSAGTDTETKMSYITVLVQAPQANFTATPTTVETGGVVTFTDLSLNNPTAWSWNFGDGGIGAIQNPTYVYNTPGVYDVSLTAANGGGADVFTQTSYITVTEALVADFTADTTAIPVGGVVIFEDLSTGGASTWNWSFPGGTPSSSSQENPIVIYPTQGLYDVSLVVSNGTSSQVITKNDYISVGPPTSIDDWATETAFTIFPNPTEGQPVTASFYLDEAHMLDFYLVDQLGHQQHLLLRHRVRAGANEIQFSINHLAAGTYYFVVADQQPNVLHYEKIVLIH